MLTHAVNVLPSGATGFDSLAAHSLAIVCLCRVWCVLVGVSFNGRTRISGVRYGGSIPPAPSKW